MTEAPVEMVSVSSARALFRSFLHGVTHNRRMIGSMSDSECEEYILNCTSVFEQCLRDCVPPEPLPSFNCAGGVRPSTP